MATNNNLITVSFTEEEITQLNQALTTIEDTIAGKVVNLTPEERQLYGKLGNNTVNWVNKVNEYMLQKPNLIPFYIDKTEFDADMKARETITPILRKITSIYESLDDTAKLLSTDI